VRAGSLSRRCRCRDADGRDLGANCPKLGRRGHGSWHVRQELPAAVDGKRRRFRRDGYPTADDAQDALDQVRALLRLGEEEDAEELVGAMLDELDKDEPLPKVEDVKLKLQAGLALDDRGTIGDALLAWYAQEEKSGKVRRATLVSYESHIRLYLRPLIGHIRRDRLNVGHLIELFNQIEDSNDRIVAANSDRRATVIEMKAASSRARKRELRARLDEMPPFRRTVGASSQQRIRATLRTCVNDLISQQKMTFNPAQYLELPSGKTRPIIWTPERVKHWRETGLRPGPVLVWPPEIVGEFLDHVSEHAPEELPMWHLMIYRGPRRGEVAGLPWAETNLAKSEITISTQLTEIEYAVAEAAPKSDAGHRTLALDAESVALLRAHRARQNREKLRLGEAWQESGRVFTRADGSPLRPSWIGDRFAEHLAAAGLPPIRLHDLRHCAATLMLAAGVDMSVIKETLGHSALATTADLYASVLPQLAQAAAEATVAIVPRRRPLGHPSATQEINNVVPVGGGGSP
jgi:integrase